MAFLAVLPYAWYRASRGMLLSRFQSLVIALLSTVLASTFESGLEIESVTSGGCMNNLFGMVLLPLTGNICAHSNPPR